MVKNILIRKYITFQQSKLMIKDCEECKARVLIDPNTFSDDGTISLSGISVSNNASHAAFAISDGGSDWRTWKIKNIETNYILGFCIPMI